MISCARNVLQGELSVLSQPPPPLSKFSLLSTGHCSQKESSEFRLIHHLSYPKGSSVNDFIPDYCSTVKYASVGDAVKLLKRLGKGCFMVKTDVKSAFRIIPIHPADYSLLGLKCRWTFPPRQSSKEV